MPLLVAQSFNHNPKERIVVKTNLHPDVMKMSNQDKQRFGNLSNKLRCIAEDNLGYNKLFNYWIENN